MIQTLVRPNLQLTYQQAQALKKIAEFLNSSKRMFGLFGYAGTGKSTIVNLVAEQLVSAGKRVVFTAPTNKAVGVLQRMATEKGVRGVDFMTIHQLLGLAPVKQGQKKILKQVSPSLLYMYDTIFLDECSMVTEELWSIIQERIAGTLIIGSNRQLIVMGIPGCYGMLRLILVCGKHGIIIVKSLQICVIVGRLPCIIHRDLLLRK